MRNYCKKCKYFKEEKTIYGHSLSEKYDEGTCLKKDVPVKESDTCEEFKNK